MDRAAAGGRLSIGALSRASGIQIDTLRTWERRYGYPVPERKPSGHRVYSVSSVSRLRRIAEALARGHRAGEVVAASDAALAALLGASPPPAGPLPRAAEAAGVADLLRAVEVFDAVRLTRALQAEWGRLGPLDFLRARVAPLVRAVGDAWATARLDVRHEHFLSERVGDLLRAFRLPLEERARGPLVALATLPGESHVLGLQMATLLLASDGFRTLYLGPETPVAQVTTLARNQGARAVGISVSSATAGRRTAAALARLRELLPRRVDLLAGGDGAPRPRPGLTVMHDLAELDVWAERVVGAR